MTQPTAEPFNLQEDAAKRMAGYLAKGIAISHTAAKVVRQRDTIKESDMIFQETMWRMSVRRQTFVSEYRAQPPGCYPW
jgi:hypothetical protein